MAEPGPPPVTAKIAAARDEGDLRENGGYHAAREEQGKQEARIRQLTDMLRRAEVGEAAAVADEVAPGTRVTIAFDGDESDTDTFLLGSREEGAHGDLEVYSPNSPLGSALLGSKAGETVSYEAPNGKQVEVKILDAKPYTA